MIATRESRTAAGMDADLVDLDHNLNVRWTMVGGRSGYPA